MKTYLITGGCGFVGSNIASVLIEQGEKVILLDNLSRVGSSDNLQWLRKLGHSEFIQADTADATAMRRAVTESTPDIVFHLAGQVAMTTSMKDPFGDFSTNVLGTINLLEALRLNSPKTALIYSSSNKVYGSLNGVRLDEGSTRYSAPDHLLGIDENAPLDFRTPYGCSKGSADQYVLEYARTYGVRTAVFRHSTIYGGRQHSTYDQGWVGWFCHQALEQEIKPETQPFTISGNGKQVRDLLYVEDAVNCYISAAKCIEQITGHAYNIGGGIENSSSLLELFNFLERKLGIKLRFKNLDWRYQDQKYFVADHSKITKITGWSPLISKEKGILKTLEWVSKLNYQTKST
jgi:CDP-paratose 2-epimerase